MGDGLLGAGLGLVSGIVNNYAADKRAQAQRDWSEKMTNQQNDWNLMMWNKTNEYNAMRNQVQRMQEAGLNPLAFNPDGSAAASPVSAASVPSAGAAQTTGIENPVMQAKQIELMNKQIDKLNSDIDKQDSETEGIKLDNQFKEDTMNVRKEHLELSNEQVKEATNLAKENIKKVIAETDNEVVKKGLIEAETWLKNANAKQIEELLPYDKLLKSAQTTAQKGAAAASFANAAYQNGLIDAGYIDAICQKALAEAKGSEAVAAINGFKASVKNGQVFDLSQFSTKLGRFGAKVMNSLFYDISVIGEALTGGLAGVLK